jgi:hypothetical protein
LAFSDINFPLLNHTAEAVNGVYGKQVQQSEFNRDLLESFDGEMHV